MATDPWAAFNPQPAAGAPVTPIIPAQPSPQTPAQKEGDVLSNENRRVNIKQGNASVANMGFDNASKLRGEFNSLPEVKNYSDALQSLAGAMKAPDNAQGDLAVVYSFAKAMDPGSVVREGEMQMANATASQVQQVNQYIQSIESGKRLPPDVRTGLIDAARQKVAGMKPLYDQQFQRYADMAKSQNFDPKQVVGDPLYDAVRPIEENYIRAHGGTPKVDGVPVGQPADQTQQGRFGDGFGAPGTAVQFKDDAETRTRATRFQDDLYNALSSKQLKSRADVDAFVQQFNQANGSGFSINWDNPDTSKAIDAALAGKRFGVERPTDPAVGQRVKELEQTGTDAGAAANVGAKDAITVGAAPRIAAVGDALRDSLSGKGSFADNYNVSLDANRSYMDELRNQHPIAFGAGELGGGLVLPGFGARTPAALAKVGAAYGAGYGAMQGDTSTSLTQRGINTAVGGGAGLTLGYALPKTIGAVASRFRGSRGAADVPDLVDAQTGELNQPMDAMSPANRVGQFRDFGINTVTPGMAGGRSARVIEQGLNNLPGSAGVMEDVNSAVSTEARRAMQDVAQQFGTSKTLAEGGAELQRGALERIERGKTVIGKAYQAIPIADDAQASTSSSVATLRDLTGRFQSNPDLAEALKDPKLVGYLGALEKGGISWKDLKDFRSIIGEKIGDMRFGESSSTSDLRALYAGLSEDMRATAAAQGPNALRSFERANNLYRENELLVDQGLTRILGKDGKLAPEKAAAAVQAMTKGGKSSGDLKTLAQVKAATVKSGAWDEIASTMIHLGGQPANSEGRAFNPQTFVNWYADMSEPARGMLFKPQLRKALDGFVGVSQQLARVKGMTNTSNTTPTMIGSGFLAAGGAAAVSHPIALLPIIGGTVANNVMARLWTSPKFVNWATGYARAVVNGNAGAAANRVSLLSKMAATNPELREPIMALLRTANDNLPRVGTAVASPDQRPDQQQ